MQRHDHDAAYLHDMLSYSRTLVRIVGERTCDQYARDELLRLVVERVIEIIGDSARNVSDAYQALHPEIPWRKIVAQRHVLALEYGRIDPAKLWRVITVHIPALIVQLEPLVPVPPATSDGTAEGACNPA